MSIHDSEVKIVLAIVIVILLAISIVRYVPLKFKGLISLALLACSAFITYKIYDGIMAPINFDKEKEVRYAKVITQLKMIRDAELAHYKITGSYERNQDKLIKFLDTAQFALVQTTNIEKTIDIGAGLTKEVTVKQIDTIGYESVLERVFKERDYKGMFNVPDTDAKFELATGTVEKIKGLYTSVFEVKVDKAIVLNGMNASLVKIEKEAFFAEQVRGPYLKVGSLEEISTNGNWPPMYDTNKRTSKNKK
ncbi:MAG: hypothetical protein HRT66_03125 [Flavobacteriaceae bacterium]|nr:hypothetical protein [Flavobacteriaceae bacterium]